MAKISLTEEDLLDIKPNIREVILLLINTINELGAAGGDVSGLAGKVTAVEGKVKTLEGNYTSLKGKVTTVESNYTALEGRVARLESPGP